MQETGNNTVARPRQRLVIRATQTNMAFAVADDTAERRALFEPYAMRAGISVAANLREAFGTSRLLNRGYSRVQVFTDAPSLMVPLDEYEDNDPEELFHYAFTGYTQDMIMHCVVPDLNVMAVFPMNKDLRLVVTDHFQDCRFAPLMQPVWSYLHRRNFTGTHKKLFAYFHDELLEVFCFSQYRFRFCNRFDAETSRDAVYYLLAVWKQLALDSVNDEMHLVGTIPERDWTLEALRRFVSKVYVINPVAEFNRAPITQIPDMTFDMTTYFLKGR